MDLKEIRQQLTALDRDIIELVAKRQQLGKAVGQIKRATGQATRDYARERDVIDAARETARGLGVSADLATSIMELLIESSLSTQEQLRVAAQGAGVNKKALVIGGGGKMGGWFVNYLRSQGFEVLVSDPNQADTVDWEHAPLDQDVIVVATPLGVTEKVLHGLAERQPDGVIFDLASIKSPLESGFEALIQAGCKVTSIHPMFGPDTQLLSKRHIVFVDVGNPEATAMAKALFTATMVDAVDMTLVDHDRLIAFVLGLSHALNISFFTALAASGENVPRLAELSSTTFDAQLAVAFGVSQESPELYYEIQSLNPHGSEARQALQQAVEQLNRIITESDKDRFVALMQSGQAYFQKRAHQNEG